MSLYAMSCLNPISVYIDPLRPTRKNGKQLFSFSPKHGLKSAFTLPCGKCVLCRDNQRKQWVNRLIAETFDNTASFLTLTYDDEHYEIPDLRKKPLQDFIKRFRVTCERSGFPLARFKYFCVNEFGRKRMRLHYHAIFFGVDLLRDPFFDSYLATYKVDKRGRRYPVYASRFIQRIWKCGFNSVDRCTDRSIRYVAKYITKSPVADDDETKAMYPQWYIYSQRIGTRYFYDDVSKSLTPFGRQVFSSGKLLLTRDGFPSRPPKFLDRYASLYEPDLYDSVKASRRAFARHRKEDVRCIKGRASDIIRKMTEQRKNESDGQ